MGQRGRCESMMWLTENWLCVNGELWVLTTREHWVFFAHATMSDYGGIYMVVATDKTGLDIVR